MDKELKVLSKYKPKNTYLSIRGYAIDKIGNEELIEKLRKILTVTPKCNPDICANPPSYEIYFESSVKFYIPRALGLQLYGEPIHNKLHKGLDCPRLVFNGNMRIEQMPSINLFMDSVKNPNKRGGIISLGCAGGKTVISLYISTLLKKKTLVICHKEFLMDQWRERISQFVPTAKVGIIKAKKIDVEDKDIVIASLHSLAMKEYDSKTFEDIGLVIADEAHHLSAEVFVRALPKVTSPVMLGLSATLNRKDGLRKVFEWFLGKPVIEVKKRDDTSMIIKMVKFWENTEEYGREQYNWNGKRNYAKMINQICAYNKRTEMIINILDNVLKKEPDRKTLIMSGRINQLKEFEIELKLKGYKSIGYYIGGMTDINRKESEKKDIILATYDMCKEGMDIPVLNTLILASPIADVEQAIGRIQRQKQEDRKYIPYTIDILDDFSIFTNQGNNRLKFYRKNKYKIEDESDTEEESGENKIIEPEFIEDDDDKQI